MADFEAFTAYYNQHMPEVYRYVHIRLHYNTQLAEDIVSEIFLKALEKFETFSENQGTFRAWIFKITKNHLIDYFRSNRSTTNVPLENLHNVLRTNDNPHETARKNLEMETVKIALATLPEEKQELLIQRYILGYSYKEIAETTAQDENTMRVTIHRALKELQRKLYELTYNP